MHPVSGSWNAFTPLESLWVQVSNAECGRNSDEKMRQNAFGNEFLRQGRKILTKAFAASSWIGISTKLSHLMLFFRTVTSGENTLSNLNFNAWTISALQQQTFNFFAIPSWHFRGVTRLGVWYHLMYCFLLCLVRVTQIRILLHCTGNQTT